MSQSSASRGASSVSVSGSGDVAGRGLKPKPVGKTSWIRDPQIAVRKPSVIPQDCKDRLKAHNKKMSAEFMKAKYGHKNDIGGPSNEGGLAKSRQQSDAGMPDTVEEDLISLDPNEHVPVDPALIVPEGVVAPVCLDVGPVPQLAPGGQQTVAVPPPVPPVVVNNQVVKDGVHVLSKEELEFSGYPEGTVKLLDGTTVFPRPMTAQQLFGYGPQVDGFHEKSDVFSSCWAKRTEAKRTKERMKVGRRQTSDIRSPTSDKTPASNAYDHVYNDIAKNMGYLDGFFLDSEYTA